IPKAEASLPSARERKVSCATPAIESTMASRSCRSFSFCRRINGSNLRSRLCFPSNRRVSGAPFAPRLDREGFAACLAGRAIARATFLGAVFGAEAFRAGFALRAAGFFAEAFFFGVLAIIQEAPL